MAVGDMIEFIAETPVREGMLKASHNIERIRVERPVTSEWSTRRTTALVSGLAPCLE